MRWEGVDSRSRVNLDVLHLVDVEYVRVGFTFCLVTQLVFTSRKFLEK